MQIRPFAGSWGGLAAERSGNVIVTIILAIAQTVVTGMFIWGLQSSLKKREKNREKREAARIKNELLLIQGVSVAINLGEATAIAVRDGHTNGEIRAALESSKAFKSEQTQFFNEQGLNAFMS